MYTTRCKKIFGKCSFDVFAATCDDWVRAIMQMTNYRAYLKRGTFGKGPSKHDLKLMRAMAFCDGKKIVIGLNEMLGVDDVWTQILHLEGEEIFESTKRKFNLPIGSKGHSHHPNKVKFSYLLVQIRSRTITKVLLKSMPKATLLVPHIWSVVETNCDKSKWHIAMFFHKSKKKCHAV